MKNKIYTVHAFRWGDRENHSYIVGIYPKKHAAQKAAEIEEEYRGGKYSCEILEWVLGEGIEGSHRDVRKMIKEPERRFQ
jgi:hypothetical protein